MPDFGSLLNYNNSSASAFYEETRVATVTNTYTDALGNVIAADVRVAGQQRDIIRVSNNTTQKLAQGDTVNLNFNRGSKHSPSIIGAGSSGTAALAASQTESLASTTAIASIPSNSTTQEPNLLWEASPVGSPNSLIAKPGRNIYTYLDPSSTTSNGYNNGTLQFNFFLPRLTNLPNVSTTGFVDGTVAVLVDSYGSSLGLYQLIKPLGAWERLDVGLINPQLTSPSYNFADNVIPSGTINGINNIFTLPNTPNPPSSLHVTLRTLERGPNQWTLSGNTLTMNNVAASIPVVGDSFFVSYRY